MSFGIDTNQMQKNRSQNMCMNDKEVLDIIMNKKEIDNGTLSALLYRLCNAGDNPDDDKLRIYTHLPDDVYDSKIIGIFSFMCKQLWYGIEVLECKNITKEDIKDKVDVLPVWALIDFLTYLDTNYFMVIDYEAPDFIYECDYLLDILMDTIINDIIYKDLTQDIINNIVDYINDLDLFDVVLYKEYNEV